MKKGILGLMIAVALMFLIVPACAGAEQPAVSVLVLDLPPWFFQKGDGAWDGFGVELARTLVEKAGFRMDAQLLPWTRALEYIKSGQLDMFVNLSRTSQREEFIDFIGVSAFDQVGIFVLKENAGIVLNTLDDLARPGYLWGIRDKSFYSNEFHRRMESDAEFRSHFEVISQFGVNIERVKAGRIIGGFGDMLGVKFRIQTDPSVRDSVVLEVPFFPSSPVYFGVSRKLSVDMRNKLKTAYAEHQQQKAFEAILAKWTEAR